MAGLSHDKWAGTTYGNGWMHRTLIGWLRHIDVRWIYAFSYVFVIGPAMLTHRYECKSIYRYFRRRFGMGRLRAAWMTYVNHCQFTQVVVDKFAMYAGRKFKVTIDGYDRFLSLSDRKEGFVQLSSHIGAYEIAGYTLQSEKKRINALVFGGEKDSIMANRMKLFEAHNIRMIAMREDMSHLFEVNEALREGEILSMPADRVFGSNKCFDIDFLGAPARFPQGPFMMAAMRGVPLLFVSVMKRSARHYHIDVKQIEPADGKNTREKAEALARRYVAMLEETVRKYPAQWYNYFDFWAR